jgi:hypothetical protein
MDILAPDFSLTAYLEWARGLSDADQLAQAVANLKEFNAITERLGTITRPDYENDRADTLVRRPFISHPKQAQFFSDSRMANGHGRWLSGGNRSSKTTSGVRESVAFCMGFRAWLPRNHPDFLTPLRPPVVGRIFGETWDNALKGTIIPKLRDTIPPELIAKVKKNRFGIEATWDIKVPFDATGKTSRIELMSYKQDQKATEGWQGHFAHFDEPPPKGHWIATTRGLVDYGGYWWVTFTPVIGDQAWLLDDIVLKTEMFAGRNMAVWDNLYDPTTGAGALTRQNIEQFLNSLPAIERMAREFGEFPHLAGSIFKEFSPEVHGVPGVFHLKEFEIPKSWWRSVFLDTAPRKPHVVAFVAWSPDGDMYCYDGFRMGSGVFMGEDGETVLEGQTVEELTAEIGKRCAGVYPQRFFVDSAADSPDLITGRTMYDALCQKFPFEKWEKVKAKTHPIQRFTEYLVPNPAKNGRPKFFIFKKMTRATWELQRYRWDEYRGPSKDRNDPKPFPVKKDDDYVDCLLAAALNPPPEFIMGEEETAMPPINEWAQWL